LQIPITDSASAFLELVINVVGDAAGRKLDTPSFWGGLFGVIALVVIDGINFFSMKKFGKTGTAILGVKIVTRTHFLGSR